MSQNLPPRSDDAGPQAPWPGRVFLQGLRDSLPFLLVVVPFGMVFGVVATEAGLSLAQTMGFSVGVFAGASQLAALQLMSANAPVLIVMATALAVNLRLAMYSASLAPYLGAAPVWQRAIVAWLLVDQSYALAHARYESSPRMPIPARFAYYLGSVTLIVPFWCVASYLGAVLGNRIPAGLPVDFAVPITFLAVIAPMLRTLAHVAAALTSVVGVLAFAALPFNLGLLVAALIAMVVGARVEVWLARQQGGGR
ncbi:AzlC family ABC transporter permease [Pararhodobacter sp. SW119]|uniref:AzlC family ABC transporter permease n=1 Tax=Pararhodobacter sp. SW119 TaxID=2780075 RepID=UPI001AE0E862|nr:AzlC family ABC transporter permease [Pararhodobacter sp. SW119]